MTVVLARRAHEFYQHYATFIDAAKTVLFVYTLLAQTVRVRRHLRARGLRQTFREVWTWLCQVGPRHCAFPDLYDGNELIISF